MAEETRLTEAGQTQVPAKLRARLGIMAGDKLVWEDAGDGTAKVRFVRRTRLQDIIGIAPGAARGDSVAAKKWAQRGGR